MKKFHWVSISLGVVLLAVLILKIGPAALWKELSLIGWNLVPLILIEGFADLFRTQGWRHCLSGPHRSLTFFQVFRIRMAGFSINYLTPTAGVGGEITKGTLLSLKHRGPQAASGVIIGKLADALAQLSFVVVGSVTVLWRVPLPRGVWIAILVGGLLLSAGILGFLAVQRWGKLGMLLRWLVAHRVGGSVLKRATAHITRVDEELTSFYRDRPYDLPLAVFWHIAGMACGIVQSWYFLFLLTDHPSITLAAGIWFLGSWLDLLSFALPYNIGILEATRVLVFNALGFQSALGLTFGIMLRLEQIFWAGIGLLIYATLLGEKREDLQPEEESAGSAQIRRSKREERSLAYEGLDKKAL